MIAKPEVLITNLNFTLPQVIAVKPGLLTTTTAATEYQATATRMAVSPCLLLRTVGQRLAWHARRHKEFSPISDDGERFIDCEMKIKLNDNGDVAFTVSNLNQQVSFCRPGRCWPYRYPGVVKGVRYCNGDAESSGMPQ
jgi:hypothetical protein